MTDPQGMLRGKGREGLHVRGLGRQRRSPSLRDLALPICLS